MSVSNKLLFVRDYANKKEQRTINLTKDGIKTYDVDTALDNADEGGEKLITHLLKVSENKPSYKDVLRNLAYKKNLSINGEHSDTIMRNHKKGLTIPYIAAYNMNFKPEHFDELSKSDDKDIRSTIASNKHLPKSVYDKLIKDPSLQVRVGASQSNHFKPEEVHTVYGENDPIESSKNLLHKLNLHKGEKFKYDVGSVSEAFDTHSLTNDHAKKILKYGTPEKYEKSFYEIHPVTFEDAAKKGDGLTDLYFKHHKASKYNMHRVLDIATSDYMKDKHVDNFLNSCRELGDYHKEEVLSSLRTNDNLSKEKKSQLK